MIERRFIVAAHYARKFAHAFFLVQPPYAGKYAPVSFALFDQILRVGQRRELCLMRNRDYLPRARNRGQLFAHGLGYAARYAGVDLVKYHRADRICVGGNRL